MLESNPKNSSAHWAENAMFDLHLLSLAILCHLAITNRSSGLSSPGSMQHLSWSTAVFSPWSSTANWGWNHSSQHVAKLTRSLDSHCLLNWNKTSGFSHALVLCRQFMVCLTYPWACPGHCSCMWPPHTRVALVSVCVCPAGSQYWHDSGVFPASDCSKAYTVRGQCQH